MCENSEQSKFLPSLGYVLVTDADNNVIGNIVSHSDRHYERTWVKVMEMTNLIRVVRNGPFEDYS